EAGIAHGVRADAGEPRQLARHPVGVRATLLDAHEHVLAGAVGREAQIFVDEEILGRRPQRSAKRRPAVRERQLGGRVHAHSAFASSTTASAAMPSPRPVKPRPSLVVALTLMLPASQFRSPARVARIAAACGATFGRSQITVMSALPTA